jgi:hypothetical protein
VWPLLAWLAWRKGLHLLTLTLALALLSWLANVTGIRHDPTGTFFLPHTRVWELWCGAALAWYLLYRGDAWAGVRDRLDAALAVVLYRAGQRDGRSALVQLASWLGAGLLVLGFWRIRGTGFPGAWALVPVLGAMLLILAGPRAWFNRVVLASRPAVAVGLISYPLYLWHWPLLSFARIVEGGTPAAGIRAGAVVLAFVLAWATYRFVEKPIRFGARGGTRMVPNLVAGMAALALVGGMVYDRDGVSGRIAGDPSAQLLWDEKSQDDQAHYRHCENLFPDWIQHTDVACLMQKPSGNDLAVIGDSHAFHYHKGLSERLRGRGGVATFPASCATPFLDTSTGARDPATRLWRAEAYRLINEAYRYVLADPAIRTVVLAHSPTCSYADAVDMANPGVKDPAVALENGARRTFAALAAAGKQVVVVLDNPHLPFDPLACVERPLRLSKRPGPAACTFPREAMLKREALEHYERLVRKVARDFPQVRFVDAQEWFCDGQECRAVDHEGLLYRDQDHFNARGSRYAAGRLLAQIGMAD